MDGYPSGQRGLTVNQLGDALRRFESFTVHRSFDRRVWESCQALEKRQALIAQMVEHALGKGGVMGSNPIEGSYCRKKFVL